MDKLPLLADRAFMKPKKEWTDGDTFEAISWAVAFFLVFMLLLVILHSPTASSAPVQDQPVSQVSQF